MKIARTKSNRNLPVVIWKERFAYLMLLPAVAATAIFCYWPMYGIIMAFKEFKLSKGILGSPWADNFGFEWFRIMFIDPEILTAIGNTVIISFSKLIIGTTVAIVTALLLNELRNEKYKRTIQSVMYLPHFLSWVIIASLVYSIFTTTGGLFNKIITDYFHGDAVQVLANPQYFRLLVYVTNVWKEAGFGTIIYLAAIAGVNAEMYESAIIDGANRFKRLLYITLPSIKGTIIILLILNASTMMNAGFDQIFNLYSPQVYEVGDIIDTFVYRYGVQNLQFSYSTAIDLFKQVINVILLITVNNIARLLGEEGVY